MNFLVLFLLLISAQMALAQPSPHERKLIFAVDVIRHGDRTPIIEIPNARHHWAEGLGQLTPLGMHQEYELGKKFRHRYIEQEKLLPRHYQVGTIYVRSTDLDRTLMSAGCVLMGLYPPGTGPFFQPDLFMNSFALPYGFQPIPIHTKPQDQDTILLSHHSQDQIKQAIEAIPECREKEKELRPHFAAWTKATGLSIKDATDVEGLADALYIYKLKHIAIPKGLSHADIEMIMNAGRLIFKTSITSEEDSGKNLLAEISHRLKAASEKKSALKYLLYSAHDSTIMSLLTSMGAPFKEIPHYASDLNILLYQNGSHDFEVQVTLNDHPVEFSHSLHGACSLQKFVSLHIRE